MKTLKQIFGRELTEKRMNTIRMLGKRRIQKYPTVLELSTYFPENKGYEVETEHTSFLDEGIIKRVWSRYDEKGKLISKTLSKRNRLTGWWKFHFKYNPPGRWRGKKSRVS